MMCFKDHVNFVLTQLNFYHVTWYDDVPCVTIQFQPQESGDANTYNGRGTSPGTSINLRTG